MSAKGSTRHETAFNHFLFWYKKSFFLSIGARSEHTKPFVYTKSFVCSEAKGRGFDAHQPHQLTVSPWLNWVSMGLIARDKSWTFFTGLNDLSRWVRNRQIQKSHCLSSALFWRFAYFPSHTTERTTKRQIVDFYWKLTLGLSKLERL